MSVSAETLIDEIKDDFCHYLRQGFRPDNIVADLPNLNVDDVENLLKLHFLMRKKVQEFVDELPKRLRRLKISTKRESVALKGEVRGRIRWDSTFHRRYQSGGCDSTVFVCDQSHKNHNIAENLVLKRLLLVLHEIVEENNAMLGEKPDWLKEWFGEKQLQSKLRHSCLRNIHIKGIELDEAQVITERTINTARNSRKIIYQDAAKLLSDYRDIINYDLKLEKAQDLLKNTFIRPHHEERLFELYWLIKRIKAFDTGGDSIQFKLIRPQESLLAEWERCNYKYRIYHDTVKPFKFFVRMADEQYDWRSFSPDSYIHRTGRTREKFEELSKRFFDQKASDGLWGGRPDIILTVTKHGEKRPEQVFIGEVKYTSNPVYAREGLRELLEYMAFVQDKEGEKAYIDQRDGENGEAILNSPRVKGILFTDKISYENYESEHIEVIPYGKSQEAFGKRLTSFIMKGRNGIAKRGV